MQLTHFHLLNQTFIFTSIYIFDGIGLSCNYILQLCKWCRNIRNCRLLLFFVDNLHCSVIKFLCLTACRSPPKMSNLLWLTLAYQTKQRSLSATIIDWHDLLLHILCYMHIDLSFIAGTICCYSYCVICTQISLSFIAGTISCYT